MPGRDHDEQLIPEPSEAVDESGWTEEIGRLRQARADRLKAVFDALDHEEREEAPPE
jgi:hypothetical protein